MSLGVVFFGGDPSTRWCCFFWDLPTRWCCVLGIYQLVGVVFWGSINSLVFVFVSFFKDKPPMFVFLRGAKMKPQFFWGR